MARRRGFPEAIAMKFGIPWILYATPPALLAAGLLALAARRRRASLAARFAGGPRRGWADTGASAARARLDAALLLVAVAGLFLALARPLWFRHDEKSELTGVPYFVALDASRSMLAGDMKPTRWFRATNALDRFLANAGNDRVGLISFSGVAYLNAPLSFDMNAVRTTVRYLDPELMNDAGSSLGTAIERAGRYFASNNVPVRIVILVTDGEDLEGSLLPTARRWAREGVKVCAIGVGTVAGAKVPLNRWNPNSGGAKNTFGQEVVSRLDEGNLQRLASATGGRYYRLGERGEGFDRLRSEFLRPLGEASAREDLENYREAYQWPLGIAALALVLRVLLGADRARRPAGPSAIGSHLATPPRP